MTRTTKTKAKPAPKPQPKTKAKAKVKAAARPEKKSKAKPKAAPEVDPMLVLQASVDLLADAGWDGLNAEIVAERLHVGVDYVRSLFPDKLSILRAVGQVAANAMYGEEDEAPLDGDPRDRLFELMMRRYEALDPYKDGIRAALRAVPSEPLLPVVLLPDFNAALAEILDLAGLEPTLMLRLGLGAVAASVFAVWLKDDSLDQAATMAALDRRLSQLVDVATRLNLQ